MAAVTRTAAAAAAKRNEVSDVRAQLKDPALNSDPMKKRTVLQRVIALMTMGFDVASLFPEVILACFTPDLVSKKLIYFFLTTYSEKNPDLAILSINTLLKECREESPLVRGLALRSLASLREVPQHFEYLLPALQRGLEDRAAYVRKTAVLCALTVFRTSPSEFIQNDLYDKMLLMLRDGDPQVCANALEVLLEIAEFDRKLEERRERLLELGESDSDQGVASKGGGSPRGPATRASPSAVQDYAPSSHTPFLVTKAVLYHLLNNLNGLNEWQQAQMIDLIHQYTPASEEEMFDIMNVLEDKLTGMHSGLILSCCHAFIYLTQNHPTVHAQVLERIRQPLLMLLTCSPSTEATYAVLCHVKLLVKRAPDVYTRSYKSFFCRHVEPSYVKAVKIDILAVLADAESAPAIVAELVATAEDRNPMIARKAIEALGTIALRLPPMAKPILARFLEFMAVGVERVRGATLVVMTRFLRKYTDVATARPFLSALLEANQASPFRDEDSRVSLAWVLGEFGEHIDDAPYLLDTLCDNLLDESAAMRLQVLTSAVTLFFKRPAEMQQLLGRIFDVLVGDFSNADVLDRAMMYYRLLRENPTAAAHVICAPKRPITTFAEDEDVGIVDKLFFEEFNSLAVVYGVPAEKFTASRAFLGDSDDDSDDSDDSDDGDGAAGNDGAGKEDVDVNEHGEMLLQPPSPNQQSLGLLGNRQGPDEDSGAGNLLSRILATDPVAGPAPGLPSLLSESSGSPYAAPAVNAKLAASPSSPTPSAPDTVSPMRLSDDADMEASEFQRLWGETPTQSTFTIALGKRPRAEVLEEYLEERSVFTLASGEQGGVLKLYLFAQATAESAVDALFGPAPPSSSSTGSGGSDRFLTEVVVSSDGSAQATVKTRSARGKDFATHLQRWLGAAARL